MKPEQQSINLLGITRSKAKMYEYFVPIEDHIALTKDPSALLSLAVGIIGDYSAIYNNISSEKESLEEQQNNLLFSSQYFDSYKESKINSQLDSYLLLVGSASYYLCNLPGSSAVLANRLGDSCPDMECEGLEYLLWALLKTNFSTNFEFVNENYSNVIHLILENLSAYYQTGNGEEQILGEVERLRKSVYLNGTARQLLVTDIVCSVISKRIYNSSWSCLKRYTDINIEEWRRVLTKKTFIQEFWPAQQLLGDKGVFNGRSAIVQMPTSAGKTKSIEIIIRSSFLSGRSQMAIIVAPFRALCSEIKNSLTVAFEAENVDIDSPSDTFQVDFNNISDIDFETNKLILVLTPEKFMYMLRHEPELAEKIGLILYDEGHQFDNGLRGVTYELLLSSLKRIIPKSVQSVLISAVISNAEAIGNWLIGETGVIVSGANLSPTFRTVAFTSWKDQRGRLEFVNQNNPESKEYFVPRVIEQSELALRGRESKKRYFPERTNGKSIALYLGLKLVQNGSIAIFCGNKSTVLSLCEEALDVFSRGYQSKLPIEISDQVEVSRLSFLLEKHFGPTDIKTRSSKIGIFGHSGNTPQGVRLAIEYAMQKGKIKFIICTSTLAQGVNLPIKYLIITSVYQAGQKIKTRDFHNLIGRAGRSGMHTEGSIIFADSEVYDQQNSKSESWRWNEAKKILDPKNTEPCISTLSSIFDPIYSDDKAYSIAISPLDFVKAYIESAESLASLPEEFANRNAEKKFTKAGLTWQFSEKMAIISAIESYLMAYWESKSKIPEEDVADLAKETLAYFLADEEKKVEILKLFTLLAQNVNNAFADANKRKAYGKTLLGVRDLLDIEKWTLEKMDILVDCLNCEELLRELWPILSIKITSTTFAKIVPKDYLLNISLQWINGVAYFELLELLIKSNVKIQAGSQMRNPQQDTVIDICDNALAFDATLILSAITEVIGLQKHEKKNRLISKLNELQKRLKYGLKTSLSIAFYEIGFSDRVIATELAAVFSNFSVTRKELLTDISLNQKRFKSEIDKYPQYYLTVFNEIINRQ